MEYYYKQIDEQGNTVSLVSYNGIAPNITDPSYVEITAEEFATILAEMEAKYEAEILANGEATTGDYLEALAEMGVEVE